MKTRRIAILLSSLMLVGLTLGCATSSKSAKLAGEKIAFTSAAANDVLIVSLRGAGEAQSAWFEVRDPQGRPVYEASVALAVLAWDNPVAKWTPQLARARLWLKSDALSSMKPDLVAKKDAGVGAFWPEDEAALARAEAADRPVLCYVEAPGGALCIWYDDAIGRGVALLHGAS